MHQEYLFTICYKMVDYSCDKTLRIRRNLGYDCVLEAQEYVVTMFQVLISCGNLGKDCKLVSTFDCSLIEGWK